MKSTAAHHGMGTQCEGHDVCRPVLTLVLDLREPRRPRPL